uniref:Bromo domain-containing protein n=1 Tax=Panagrolaimus davidi TaxID=227884 RepID=A0A914PV63_9BILA
MSLIDIESAKKVVETISQIPTATLTPKILPTQKQPFEFPLRSTSSFPYILEKVGEKMEKENSHQAYDEIMYQINAVQFNAGCSSSSTDLDKLIEFYNNHSDEDTMAQWMNIYEEQKLANSIAANSRAGNNNNNHHYGGGETNLGRFKNRKFYLFHF